MKLIFKKEREQEKEKTILDALAYGECIVEYLDNEVDIERILIVMGDNLENVVVFWRSSVYTYSLSGDLSRQEIYEQIKNDYAMEKIVDIYPVSSTITFERIKK